MDSKGGSMKQIEKQKAMAQDYKRPDCRCEELERQNKAFQEQYNISGELILKYRKALKEILPQLTFLMLHRKMMIKDKTALKIEKIATKALKDNNGD